MDVRPTAVEAELDERLERFLAEWLGSWPPHGELEVTTTDYRSRLGWDGRLQPLTGVSNEVGTVISVAAPYLEGARELAKGGLASVDAGIGALFDRPGARLRRGIFRACRHLVLADELGQWVDSTDERLPEWLHAFSGEVLVAFDEAGAYAAGVGLKHHHQLNYEIAVGTEPQHRGRGLARTLVAQAARRIYEQGAVATYQHAADNFASAKVAEASGFPDLGWRSVGLGAPNPAPSSDSDRGEPR
jgi:GNAT superfamily N-acetyltransferase